MPFKFLTPWGTTQYSGVELAYHLPAPGQKWSEVTWAPDMQTRADGLDCGPGGLHLMKTLSVIYAPIHWWPWYAQPVGLVLGESAEKLRVQGVRLRRITAKTFWRMIRCGWCWRAHLEGAQLQGAQLQGAQLWGAHLEGANLEGAQLWGAHLEGAQLQGAQLWGANLEGAQLQGAKYNRFTIWPDSYHIRGAINEA